MLCARALLDRTELKVLRIKYASPEFPHHKFFENNVCVKHWFEPEEEKIVVFPKEEPPLLHPEDIGKYVIKQNELDKKHFRIQFIVTYNGFSDVDVRTYYTLTNFELNALTYEKLGEVEINKFKVIQPSSDEGFIGVNELKDKLDVCKDFNSI